MITVTCQLVVGLLAVVFGLSALQVADLERRSSALQRMSWKVAGAGFVLGGASGTVMNVWAAWAFLAGPGSAVWNEYLRWAPSWNHGGAFLKACLGCALVVAAVGRREPGPGFLRRTLAVLVAALFAGGVAGWIEGPLDGSVHFTNAAIFETVELIAMFAALLTSLFRDSMDRLLWIALTIYTVRQALNAILWMALAWARVPGAWVPKPVTLQLFGIVSYGVMLALSYRRVTLARRRVPVGTLLEPPARVLVR